MANALHSSQTISDGIHIGYSFEYANESARTSDTSKTSADIGKFARQLSDDTIWMLTSTAPLWAGITGGSVSGSVPNTRYLSASSGLTGGGDLSADRSFSVSVDPSGSIAIVSGSVVVGVLTSDSQHGARGGNNLHFVATPSSAGFMSAADKTTFNSIVTELTGTRIAYALQSATTVVYVSSSIAPASGSTLNSISSTQAQWEPKLTLTDTVPVISTRATSLVGTSSFAARSDHKHDVSTATASSLLPGSSNSEGSATSLARSDHSHSLPTFGTVTGSFAEGNDSRLTEDKIAYALRSATTIIFVSSSAAPVSGSTLVGLSSTQAQWEPRIYLSDIAASNLIKSASIAGVSPTASRSDHKHDIVTDVATTWSIGSTATEGTSTSLARADHIHAVASPSAPVNVTKSAASAGVATAAARADHKHDITTDSPDALSVGAIVSEGTNTTLARSDHRHHVPAGTPSNIGNANSAGVSTDFVRADHVHNLPFSAVQTTLSGASGPIYFNDQNLVSVGLINGTYYYQNSAIDPTIPTPTTGSRYYNTILHEYMIYDDSRVKFLSTAQITVLAGASGATASGSYFRGMDGLAYSTNIGAPVPKGTVVGLGVIHTDSTSPIIEVLVDGSIITAITASGAGLTVDWAQNADFSEGYMQFRNKLDGGSICTNTQITTLLKRRV